MNLKGSLPMLILQALAVESLHGYRIAQDIKSKSFGVLDFKEGTLYPALHKLEQDKQIKSEELMVDGRKRRCYKITTTGKKALAKSQQQWQQYVQAVNLVLQEA